MSKLIKASIDLTKIDKQHIIAGKNGAKYINLDIWVNDEKDKYDNDCGVKQSYKVGEEFQSHYIGNGRKTLGWDSEPTTSKPDPDVEQVDDDQLPF